MDFKNAARCVACFFPPGVEQATPPKTTQATKTPDKTKRIKLMTSDSLPEQKKKESPNSSLQIAFPMRKAKKSSRIFRLLAGEKKHTLAAEKQFFAVAANSRLLRQ